DLFKHKILFDRLRPGHMSGDEAVTMGTGDDRQQHPRVYHIVELAWQSEEFKTFVRTLDEWNIENFRIKVGRKLSGGNSPRERIALAKPRVIDSPAPKGLWRNCYSPTWLAALKPHVREQLQIIDKDYDFSLPTYKSPEDLNTMDWEEEDEDGEEDGEDEDEDGEDEDTDY
ncbi:hypothetical protein C8Q76DRAFT_636259, partial [Earliella scabrosa]